MDTGRRVLAIALAILAFNYFFVANSADHVKIGWIWLAVDVVFWWPELRKIVSKVM